MTKKFLDVEFHVKILLDDKECREVWIVYYYRIKGWHVQVWFFSTYLNIWVEAGLLQSLPVLSCLKAHLIGTRNEGFSSDETWTTSITVGSSTGKRFMRFIYNRIGSVKNQSDILPCCQMVPSWRQRIQEVQRDAHTGSWYTLASVQHVSGERTRWQSAHFWTLQHGQCWVFSNFTISIIIKINWIIIKSIKVTLMCLITSRQTETTKDRLHGVDSYVAFLLSITLQIHGSWIWDHH